jgi:hypothetical protein
MSRRSVQDAHPEPAWPKHGHYMRRNVELCPLTVRDPDDKASPFMWMVSLHSNREQQNKVCVVTPANLCAE